MAAIGLPAPGGERLRIDPKWPILAASAALAAYLALIPLTTLVSESLKTSGQAWGVGNFIRAYGDPQAYALLFNSFVYAAAAAALSFAVSFCLAWMVERTNLPGRQLVYAAALVPLIVPGVVTTIAWLLLLSPKIGLLN